MSLLVRFYPLLVALTKIRDKKCVKQLLKELSRDPQFRKCLKEITVNVLKENIPLSSKEKRKLNKHAKVIRDLKLMRKSDQSGGFLNIVIPLLATIVGELIARRQK